MLSGRENSGHLIRSALTVLLSALLWPTPALAEETEPTDSDVGLSATVEIVSDYRFRGISLSNRKPALQAGVEYAHATGFFAGAWGSTIAEYGGADQELDLYAGYSGETGRISYTVAATQYLYPGGSGVNYFELSSEIETALGPATLALEAAYIPDQKNSEDNLYTGATLSYAMPHDISAFARAGRENGLYDDKWDWELGLSHERGPLTLRASYVDTNYSGELEAGDDAEPTILVAAGLSF